MSELRIYCCIPGCRRSWKDDGKFGEIMCGRHWKMGTPLLRNRSKRIRATIRGIERRTKGRTVADDARIRRLWRIHDLIWQRVKAAATGTEKPAGLDAVLAEIGVL